MWFQLFFIVELSGGTIVFFFLNYVNHSTPLWIKLSSDFREKAKHIGHRRRWSAGQVSWSKVGIHYWLVVTGCHFWLISQKYWEFHHPNWRSHIFQRGGPGPPTRLFMHIHLSRWCVLFSPAPSAHRKNRWIWLFGCRSQGCSQSDRRQETGALTHRFLSAVS